MKTAPIVAAKVERDERGVPFSPMFGDVYHPAAGALQQAGHVFLRGNGLPERFAGRDCFVVLETGFGLGNNFLATWLAWRQAGRPCRLHFISIEQFPLTRDDLAAMPRDPQLAELARGLHTQWPALTHNLHQLSFDDDRVQLMLAFGDAHAWLPELSARVDAFYLDGFSPAKNPRMWESRILKALGRLAADGATAATWSAARAVRDGLVAAGFKVTSAPGQGGKRDITIARYAPAFTPRRGPSRLGSSARGHAIVVGAGLAGCASAWALARQAWECTVLDANEKPAGATSGNPAGLFHGIVNPQDGAHARFNRAAALESQRVFRSLLERHPRLGEMNGLLRLETSGDEAECMRRTLTALGLPPDYVQALDASQASAAAGMALSRPAWFYPAGGWLRPHMLCGAFLGASGPQVQFRGATRVQSLQPRGDRWQVFDSENRLIAEADAVILANAGDALHLAGHADWPVSAVRGQISMASSISAGVLPRIPLAGSGYLLPMIDGQALFGATTQVNDFESACRDADHEHNLRQVHQLTSDPAWLALSPAKLHGRVGWRWIADDRLPVIGGVPLAATWPSGTRLDQPRMVPRQPGLFIATGLSSRGITWCTLGAQLLASMVTGAPSPLESGLVDAVDAARFASRAARRATT